MTMIDYIIPGSTEQETNAKVTITDMMGREMLVLVNEYQTSGKHSIPFEWQNLSNGTYYVIVEIAGIRTSKVQTVIK